MERRSTSVRQLELLLDYMESHRDLALGRVRSKEARALANRLWAQCTERLNSEGSARTPKEWTKFWNDYKCRVRVKLAEINRAHTGTGGGPSTAPQLTPLEERVAAILGRDVGPLPGVRMDPPVEAPQIEELVLVPLEAEESPILDIGPVLNMVEVDEDSNRTQMLTPQSPPALPRQDEPSTSAAQNVSATPPPPAPPQARSSRQRPSRPPRVRRSTQQSNTYFIDQARADIARIQETQARIEATNAQANLRAAEIGSQMVQALTRFADAMQTIAQCLQNYTANLPSNQNE